MNSRMLDVAIGLVLVFAITSLLTTALQELWTSHRGNRGVFLRKAMVSFFGDDPAFADSVLRHPLVVSMAPLDKNSKRNPSYLHADVMVSALIAHLAERYSGGIRPSTPGELVRALKFAMPATGAAPAAAGTHPNDEFLRSLTGLVMGVEHDWPAYEARLSAWYDTVCARSSGWFKRHLQVRLFLFGLLAATIGNINPIIISTQLWHDEALRKATVAIAEQASKPLAQGASADTAPKPDAVKDKPDTATTTRDKSATLMAALQASMTQAGRSADDANVTGLPGVMVKLIDLGEAMNRLRQPLAADATAASHDQRAADKAKVAGLLAEAQAKLPNGPQHASLQQGMKALQQAVQAELAPAKVATAKTPADCPKPEAGASPSPGASAADSGVAKAERDLCLSRLELAKLAAAGLPIGWDDKVINDFKASGCKPASEDSCEWPSKLKFWVSLLLGWGVTAVACTLGAPFWFDLLSQLVKLRGSGTRPGTPGSGGSGAAAGSPGGPAAGGPANSLLARSASTAANDSALPDPVGAPMRDVLNDAEHALTVPEVQRVQRGLQMADAQVSGFFDGSTRAAIQRWQAGLGLPVTGELSATQIQQLLGLAPGRNGNGYLA